MWFMPLDSLEILFYFKSYLTVSQHPNGWMGKLKNFCYVLCYYFNKCIIPSIIPSISYPGVSGQLRQDGNLLFMFMLAEKYI